MGEQHSIFAERPVEQALDGGSALRAGWFRFLFDDERWEWSEQVQRMHGYEPGTVIPTTELVLSHKHPDDKGQVAAMINDMRRTRKPFSTRHRIIDTHGEVRNVIVVGDQYYNDVGEVVGTHGFYVDVTPGEQVREAMITAAVAEISEHRAVIEQTKGMLMLAYGIDASAAFGLLKWRSQETNTKLRLLAGQIATDFRTVASYDSHPPRSTYDQLLLTAHFRVRGSDEATAATV